MTRMMEREGINRSQKRIAYLAVLAAMLANGMANTRAAEPGKPTITAGARASIAGVPLNFEPNVGQAKSGAQFLAHGPAYTVSLSAQGATLDSQGSLLRLHVVGSKEGVTPAAEQPLSGVVNYYIGNDPTKWVSGVKTFGKVRYAGVYPGVDLVYYGTQGRLEYDFAVSAGATAKSIRLAIEGAQQVRLDHDGGLKVQASNGHEVAFEHPVAYQLNHGRRVPVAARYKLAGNTVHFEIVGYDHSKQLIIDPVLSYFSYLGGSLNDVIGNGAPSGASPNNFVTSKAAAVDSAGDLYVVGYTTSTNFPTQSASIVSDPATANLNNETGFVTKFAPDAKSLIFSTYLGGTNGFDQAFAVALDSSGNAFVVGSVASNDFPITTGAYQTLCSATYGGSNGTTPTANCSDPGNNGAPGAFVSKFSPTGALLASTFLGGENGGTALAVTVDSTGRPYVAGFAHPGVNTTAAPYLAKSVGFPVTAGALVGPYNYCSGSCTINGSLQYDAFVSVFNPTLTTLVYSTLYGDNQGFTDNGASLGNTYGTAVSLDAAGNIYLAGSTGDAFLPVTSNAAQPQITSCGQYYSSTDQVVNGTCGFAAKFSPVGGSSAPTLIYGTYLGHLPGCCTSNFVSGVVADASGDAYILGYADTATFPTTAGAYQTTCNQYPTVNDTNCSSAFIAKLNPTGTTVLAATYFGGYYAGANNMSDNVQYVGSIVLDGTGNVYISGTGAANLPQVNGLTVPSASTYAFVAELNSSLTSLLFSTLVNTDSGQVNTDGLALDSAGNIYLAGSASPNTTSAATTGAFQTAFGGGASDGFVAKIVLTTVTKTTLTASPTTATSGTAVNLTATVAETGGTGTPTGTVTFNDGSTVVGSMTLNGTGVAVLSTTTLSVGVHSFMAVYSGDSANSGSTSAGASVTISAPPAPTVKIAVAPTSVVLGKSAALTWSSTDATACTASNGWTGTQTISGTQSVTPSAAGSVSYVLTCTGSGGSGSATAVLTVATPAPTVTIAVAPTSVTVGQSAKITWSSTNATACTASGAWSGSQSTSGTLSVSPTAAATDSYALACTGTGGTATGTAALTVAAAATTTPVGTTTSGGSGGGAMGLWEMLALMLTLLTAGAYRRQGTMRR